MTFDSTEDERGRGPLVNTGRGGIGNAVRSPSRGRPAETAEETAAKSQYENDIHPVHGGRGGAGNIRSPSRDPADRSKLNEIERKEHALQQEAIKYDQNHPHNTGRGGAGNIRSDSGEREGRAKEGHHHTGGGIVNAIKSFSRSRSRDAKSADANGHEHGMLGKIGGHLPGSHLKEESHIEQ